MSPSYSNSDKLIYSYPRSSWNSFRSAQSIPGLSKDERVLLKKTISRLFGIYVDVTKLWIWQRPEHKEKLISQSVKELSFLSRYENAWPVEALCRSRLNKMRHITGNTAGKKIGLRLNPEMKFLTPQLHPPSDPSIGSEAGRDIATDTCPKDSQGQLFSIMTFNTFQTNDTLRSGVPSSTLIPTLSISMPDSSGIFQSGRASISGEHLPRTFQAAECSHCSSSTLNTGRHGQFSPASANISPQAPPVSNEIAVSRKVYEDGEVPQHLQRNVLHVAEHKTLPSGTPSDTDEETLNGNIAESRQHEVVRNSHSLLDPVQPEQNALELPQLIRRASSALTYLSEAPEDASEPVRAFLQSLYPPMDNLMPRLSQGGIWDQACLVGLAMLSKSEQRKFLKRDLKLNPFQVRVIRSALKRLLSENLV